LSAIYDELNLIIYGHFFPRKGQKKPKSLYAQLSGQENLNDEGDDEVMAFKSGEEFEAYRNKLLGGENNG